MTPKQKEMTVNQVNQVEIMSVITCASQAKLYVLKGDNFVPLNRIYIEWHKLTVSMMLPAF